MSYADIDLEIVPAAPPTLKNQRATSCPAPISANAPYRSGSRLILSAFWLALNLGRSSANGVSIRFVMVGAQVFCELGRSFFAMDRPVLFHRYFSSDVSPKSQLAELLWFDRCAGAA